MAEVKNAFIKSKMNKDLDSRLIPNGEYRDAKNIQVSRSQGEDVGALENIFGNAVTVNGNFAADSGVSDIECIGYVVDESNSFVYLFFTNYTDEYEGDVSSYEPSAENFIYAYNILTNERTKLLEGAFLNFSTNRPIIGVNLLENLLFWTDNRNQPRKINITIAESNGISYYNSEDKISVAKYNPYRSPEIIREVSAGVYETTMYDVTSEFLPSQAAASVNGAVVSTDTFFIDSRKGVINVGYYVTGDGVVGDPTVISFNIGTGEIVVSSNQDLDDNVKLNFHQQNPYYNANFSGDPQYLEDKFVRFSYRFKFIDGEYSIIAPFTQAAFIPKQDGYFLDGDENQTVASTVVEFMENKVDKIDLQIPLPSISDNLEAEYLITDIDILYKESDSNVVQVVESIPTSSISGSSSTYVYTYVSQKPYKTLPSDEIIRVYDKVPVKALGQEIAGNRIIYSNFQNKHTPPNFIDYQVAVNGKLDVNPAGSAKSTVEYPNHNLKENRNYQVGVVLSDKFGRQSTVILSNNISDLDLGFGADTVYLPYNPNNNSIDFLGNSIKTQFNTILSGVGIDKNEKSGVPGLYSDNTTSIDYNPLGWYSYKIVIKQNEQDYYNVYAPGAMKGSPYYIAPLSDNNPENQNASFITLVNDNINKIPRDLAEVGPQDKQFRSSVRLFGRVDVGDVVWGPGTNPRKNKQYFPGRKSFTTNTVEDLFDLFDTADFDATGQAPPITNTNNPYYSFYRSESNPFIAEIITSQNPNQQFGIVNNDYTNGRVYERFDTLTILETKPTVSRLDIYWETSTSGLVSELNAAIGAGTQASQVSGWVYNHSEDMNDQQDITGDFEFQDVLGVSFTSIHSVTMTVTNGANEDVTSKFNLIRNTSPTSNSFKVETSIGEYFYYDTNNLKNVFNFVFSVTVNSGDTASNVSKPNQPLTNIAPTITNTATDTILLFEGVRDIPLANGTPSGKATGVNGSNPLGGRSTDNLIFSIGAQSGVGNFEIDTTDGVSVINTDYYAVGDATFKLKLEDGGSPTNLSTTLLFSVNFDASNF